jgi:glycosyltransferase involved in cell wall biosynthesis
MQPDAKPRLLIVTESLGVGGTESHLLRTLPRLAEDGFNITVFCLAERGARATELEAAGIDVRSPPKIASEKRSLLRYPAHITLAANRLYRLMRRLRPHIVHFYLPGPYLIGAPVAIAAATPIKVMSRRSLSLYQQNWPLAGLMERRLHARMDAVIGNSRAVVRELIAEGIPEAKVRLIYNGIEAIKLPDRAKARAALGLDQDSLVGIIVANLIAYKGHRDLIEALSHVQAHFSPPWRILAAGRDQGLRAGLEVLARAKGVSGRIQFIGERDDIPFLLAAADFGLLTSREEGFSNVILEGMAAALPMIVTGVGGNAEAVLDGETGFVVPPGNPKAIGEAILRVARDAALRNRLGAAGRARVEKEFSISRCVRSHAELYQNLLDKRRSDAPGIAAE